MPKRRILLWIGLAALAAGLFWFMVRFGGQIKDAFRPLSDRTTGSLAPPIAVVVLGIVFVIASRMKPKDK